MKKRAAQPDCPCGSGRSYVVCCQPWHAGAPAPTAEALMRSRYAAYVLELSPYLLATWHASTRPAEVTFDEPSPKWLGLEVKRHSPEGDSAVVEFIARYKTGGRAMRLHEISRFVREDGCWFYVDGTFCD